MCLKKYSGPGRRYLRRAGSNPINTGPNLITQTRCIQSGM